MYDHIFARSFSRNEQKRFGNCALVICFFVALSVCAVFRPSFHLSVLNFEASTSEGLNMLLVSTNDRRAISQPQPSTTSHDQKARSTISDPLSTSSNKQAKSETDRNMILLPRSTNKKNRTSEGPPHQESHLLDHSLDSETKETKVMCNFSEMLSDHCEIQGDIRIDGNSSTIFVVSSNSSNLAGNSSSTIRPYARKQSPAAMSNVRKWTITTVEGQANAPSCTNKHTDPAVLFSTRGYSGNHFHSFSDILVPLFANSRTFNKKVHLVATNYQSWWISKFKILLNELSAHEVLDVDREGGIHCYKNAIIGLKSHKELGVDASRSSNGYSMKDFRDFLRSAYSLQRKTAIKLKKGDKRKPRLLLISRRTTRRLMNEDEIIKMAERIGFQVLLTDATFSTNVSSFAQVVNSCDVLLGVHGAGLTNMVFQPEKAVVIQVVPLGGIEWFANTDFGEPSKDMNLRYLRYSIRVKESSLITQYPLDHVVFKDPMSIHRQGWDAIRTIYLDKQNVNLDVRRFRSTLVKAFKLLHH